MTENTNTTAAPATREIFPGDTPVWINFPGAIGRKPGHVVTDEGGVKIEVRYEKKGQETFKEVAAHQVTLREAEVETAATDSDPERDETGEVTANPVDGPAETEAPAEKPARKPRAKAEPKEQGPARPKAAELLALAQEVVIDHGPREVLARSGATRLLDQLGREIKLGEVVLNDDERADLDRMAMYQAGRVLIFFKRDAPEGHESRRF